MAVTPLSCCHEAGCCAGKYSLKTESLPHTAEHQRNSRRKWLRFSWDHPFVYQVLWDKSRSSNTSGEWYVWKSEIIKEEVAGDILTWTGPACCCHSLTLSDFSWKILKIAVSHIRLQVTPTTKWSCESKLISSGFLQMQEKIQPLRAKVTWLCIYSLCNNSRLLKRDAQQRPLFLAYRSYQVESLCFRRRSWTELTHPGAACANAAEGKAFQEQLEIITHSKPDRDSADNQVSSCRRQVAGNFSGRS